MREAGNFSPGYDLEAMKRGLEAEGGQWSLFGGEPLLMKLQDLEEMLRWGHATHGATGIQTNGSLITPAHLALFARFHTHVGISVDGPDELNDSRWAGSLGKTRAATAASLAAIDALCAAGRVPSLIVTLHRGNAAGDRLPRLLAWFRQLDAKGIRHLRVHALEVDAADVRRDLALTEAEAIAAFDALFDLHGSLATLKIDVFADMANLLLGSPDKASCVWHGCDPLSTPAVRGVDGLGGRTNCTRTNKDGVPWLKADTWGNERSRLLYETPQADGGCQDCRFFFACQGNCPGTGLDGDWRNRSEHCGLWLATFTRIEGALVALGRAPISLDPVRLAAAEIAVLERQAGNVDHQDHFDAPLGYEHSDGAVTIHGDLVNGVHTTLMHGDAPHEDHTDVPHVDDHYDHGDGEHYDAPPQHCDGEVHCD